MVHERMENQDPKISVRCIVPRLLDLIPKRYGVLPEQLQSMDQA